MLDNNKIAEFISYKRKQLGLTQADVAERLNVSFQAVSKWENGTLPNVEILAGLAELLQVSVDEVLAGREKSEENLSYSKAGVDISYTDAMKKEMAVYLETEDKRVLNGLGPFAALYDINFPEISNPVLVLKSEEPGSKQKLAMEYGYSESICHDMVNHLVNDICVMGARPLAVLDTIVCGNAEKETIKSFVKGISESCKENECVLVGGETSIQPQVVDKGVYILTSSIAGIVEKGNIILLPNWYNYTGKKGGRVCESCDMVNVCRQMQFAFAGVKGNDFILYKRLGNIMAKVSPEEGI